MVTNLPQKNNAEEWLNTNTNEYLLYTIISRLQV